MMMDAYQEALVCWVDMEVASRIGPALGVEPPRSTLDAKAVWQERAKAAGAEAGKDSATVDAEFGERLKGFRAEIDAKLEAAKRDPSPSLDWLKPYLSRAEACEIALSKSN